MKRFLQCLPLLLILSGCSKEKVQVIPSDFKDYVDRFFMEGNQRGWNKNLEDVDLKMEFGAVSDNAAGQCSFQKNRITIDELTWNTLSEVEKTWLIFHELGHCVLNRQHKNEETENEDCLSFMKGAENNFKCSLNLFSEKWWNYYMDELFESSTPLPDWYLSPKNDNSLSILSNLVMIDTISQLLIYDDLDFSLYDNYQINFEFRNLQVNPIFVKFYFGNIGFGQCDECVGTNVRISSDQPNQLYYSNFSGGFQFQDDLKLTIRKKEEDLIFYVNDQFIHVFEQELWNGNNKVQSITFFDEAVDMKLTIDEIE